MAGIYPETMEEQCGPGSEPTFCRGQARMPQPSLSEAALSTDRQTKPSEILERADEHGYGHIELKDH